MLEKILPLVLIVVSGYLLKKLKFLEKSDTKVLGKLLGNLVLPALVFRAIFLAKIEPNLLYLPLSALLVVLSLTLIAWFGLRFIKSAPNSGSLREHSIRGAFITTFPTFESGAIGYPLMFLAFGDLGLSRIVLFDMAHAVFLFTVVYFISCQFGQTKFEFKDGIVNLVKTPLIWAVMLAIIFKVIGFHSSLLLDTLEIAENSFFFLILLLLSLEFNFDFSYFKLSMLITITKTFCGAALGWLATMIFGLTGLERIAVIIGSAQPPSMLTLIFAEKNELDTKFVANLLSISLTFSCIFLTILLRLLSVDL